MGFSDSRFLAALTASCLIAIPFEAQAQAQDPAVAETGLAEITVTAQRREENQERAPIWYCSRSPAKNSGATHISTMFTPTLVPRRYPSIK
jgi:hypothetical protein